MLYSLHCQGRLGLSSSWYEKPQLSRLPPSLPSTARPSHQYPISVFSSVQQTLCLPFNKTGVTVENLLIGLLLSASISYGSGDLCAKAYRINPLERWQSCTWLSYITDPLSQRLAGARHNVRSPYSQWVLSKTKI